MKRRARFRRASSCCESRRRQARSWNLSPSASHRTNASGILKLSTKSRSLRQERSSAGFSWKWIGQKYFSSLCDFASFAPLREKFRERSKRITRKDAKDAKTQRKTLDSLPACRIESPYQLSTW